MSSETQEISIASLLARSRTCPRPSLSRPSVRPCVPPSVCSPVHPPVGLQVCNEKRQLSPENHSRHYWSVKSAPEKRNAAETEASSLECRPSPRPAGESGVCVKGWEQAEEGTGGKWGDAGGTEKQLGTDFSVPREVPSAAAQLGEDDIDNYCYDDDGNNDANAAAILAAAATAAATAASL